MKRRTKSKRGFRKTKKLVRKIRSRSESRSQMKSLVGGGGACSTGRCAYVSSPVHVLESKKLWHYTWDGRILIEERPITNGGIKQTNISIPDDIVSLRYYVVKHIKLIEEYMEDESQTIALLGYIKINVNDFKIENEKEISLSFLSYLFYKYSNLHPDFGRQRVYLDIPYKLIWWLIEHGANVNYNNTLPRGKEGVNYFTILGDVIQLLINFNLSTTQRIINSDGTWNLINLTDFYNIVYTLVLLLSRGANMQMHIVTWDSTQYTRTTTALEMLKTKDEAWMTQMKELSRNLNSMSETSTFDIESQQAFDSDRDLKAKTDIMIQKFKILIDPFNNVLDLHLLQYSQIAKLTAELKAKHTAKDEAELTKLTAELTDKLDALKDSCKMAMKTVYSPPYVKVVWMIESKPGNNLFIDLDENGSNLLEQSFIMGDNVVISGDDRLHPDSKTEFENMTFTSYISTTVGGERKEIVKRIWRDIRDSIDPSELADLQWKGPSTQRDPDITWFYASDDGRKFKSYLNKFAEVIENAFIEGKTSVIFSPYTDVTWVIDLIERTQTNPATTSTRRIQRGKVKWEWEWKNDHGNGFNLFEPQVAQLLEKAYNKDEPIVNHTSTSKPWKFDLDRMTQTNTFGDQRTIRRTIVPVYS